MVQGAVTMRLLGDSRGLEGALKNGQRSLQTFSRAAVLGAGAAVAGLGFLAGKAVQTGDTLEKMSRRTGLGVETLSEYSFAASQSGTSIETLEGSVRRMARVIDDADRGLSTAVDSLAALGLSVDDLRGKDPDQQFRMLAQALSEVEDDSTRAALAQQVFGRAGSQILPLIEDGTAGLDRYAAEARNLGLVMSTEQAVAAAEAADAQDRLTRVLGAARDQILLDFIPIITALATRFTDWLVPALASLRAWFDDNRPRIEAAINSIIDIAAYWAGNFVEGIRTMLGWLSDLRDRIDNDKVIIIAAIAAIAAAVALALGPVGLVAAAIAGGIAIIGRYSSNWARLRLDVLEALQGILQGAIEVMPKVARVLFEGAAFLQAELPLLFARMGVEAAERLTNFILRGLRAGLPTIGRLLFEGAAFLAAELPIKFAEVGVKAAEGLVNFLLRGLRNLRLPRVEFDFGPFGSVGFGPFAPFSGVGNANFSSLRSSLSSAASTARQRRQGVGAAIEGRLAGALQGVDANFEGVSSRLATAQGNARQLRQNVGAALEDFLQPLAGSLSDSVGNALQPFIDDAREAADATDAANRAAAELEKERAREGKIATDALIQELAAQNEEAVRSRDENREAAETEEEKQERERAEDEARRAVEAAQQELLRAREAGLTPEQRAVNEAQRALAEAQETGNAELIAIRQQLLTIAQQNLATAQADARAEAERKAQEERDREEAEAQAEAEKQEREEMAKAEREQREAERAEAARERARLALLSGDERAIAELQAQIRDAVASGDDVLAGLLRQRLQQIRDAIAEREAAEAAAQAEAEEKEAEAERKREEREQAAAEREAERERKALEREQRAEQRERERAEAQARRMEAVADQLCIEQTINAVDSTPAAVRRAAADGAEVGARRLSAALKACA